MHTDYAAITEMRASDPQAIERAPATRTKRPAVRRRRPADDHRRRPPRPRRHRRRRTADRDGQPDRPARAARAALARPGVDGLLATPDILEDLLLLGALEGKVAFGSMNRGGLRGAQFELDDQFTGYDARRPEPRA